MTPRVLIGFETSGVVRRALWLLMEKDIRLYLMANTEGRYDNINKATLHATMCENWCKVVLGIDKYPSSDESFASHGEANIQVLRRIHDETRMVTSYLDTEIGFPIYDRNPDYDALAPLFFEKFLDVCESAMASQWGGR